MPKISRRGVLTSIAASIAGVGAGTALTTAFTDAPSSTAQPSPIGEPTPSVATPSPRSRRVLPRGDNPVAVENRLKGSREWQVGSRAADDIHMQVQGYTSATSVRLGDSIEFHVRAEEAYRISIYRLGYYGGANARHVMTSPTLKGIRQPAPKLDEVTGLISCAWEPVWRLDVPTNWISGAYLAVFTSESGWRSSTPFVVRDDQRVAGLCVILPFSTYQAYNRWPYDGKLGKSLYNGYEVNSANRGARSYNYRAVKVSFDRPYSGHGLPSRFDADHYFVRWVEQAGYDLTYATSTDLHSGLIDPGQYAGLIFCGHDEYWSVQMRDIATDAVAQGTSLGFMMANNVYWHVRFEPSADGRDNRIVVCYKSDPDPGADRSGATTRWRDIDPTSAEQRLVGVQYNGIVATPAPLVVKAADHWFWAGCGVEDGDRIANLVDGEADGLNTRAPHPEGVTQTLLSASPYRLRDGKSRTQNSSVYETPQGAVVFDAATFNWTSALSQSGHRDGRIQKATANLFERILQPWE